MITHIVIFICGACVGALTAFIALFAIDAQNEPEGDTLENEI